MIEAKDMLGNTLKAGSIITYPVRQSSSMWMNLAVVLDVEVKERGGWYKDEQAVTYPVLKVLTVGTDWMGKKVTTRKTYVERLDRVVSLRSALLHPLDNEVHKRIMVEQGNAILNERR